MLPEPAKFRFAVISEHKVHIHQERWFLEERYGHHSVAAANPPHASMGETEVAVGILAALDTVVVYETGITCLIEPVSMKLAVLVISKGRKQLGDFGSRLSSSY